MSELRSEDLGTIGDAPFNNIVVKPLSSFLSVPRGGYSSSMSKAAPVSSLRQALSSKIDVPLDGLSLAYMGKDLDDEHTLRGNGIVEPGPAARRSGVRVELVFTLRSDVVLGAARRASESERDRQRAVEEAEVQEPGVFTDGGAEYPEIEEEAEVQVAVEEIAREVEPPRQVRGAVPQFPLNVLQEPVEVGPVAQPADLPEVPGERCVLQFVPVGVGDGDAAPDAAVGLETTFSATVREVAQQLHGLLGGGGTEPILVHRGHLLEGRTTVRLAGIQDAEVVQFFFGAGDDVAADDVAVMPGAGAAHGEDPVDHVEVPHGLEVLEPPALNSESEALKREAGSTVFSEHHESPGESSRSKAQEAQIHRSARLDKHVARIVVHDKHRNEEGLMDILYEVDRACSDTDSLADEAPDTGQMCQIPWLVEAGHSQGQSSSSGHDSETIRLLEELRAFLLRPRSPAAFDGPGERASDRMTEAEIAELLGRHVPDIHQRTAPECGNKPVLRVIVSSYREGLPIYNTATRQYLALCLRRLLAVLREREKAGTITEMRVCTLCTQIVDAFEACQASQARVIETLMDELSGEPTFEHKVRALALELQERTIDRTVLSLHPDSDRNDIEPSRRLAHLVNRYRQLLGFSGINHEDIHQSAVVDLFREDVARARYGDLLDHRELIVKMMNDVNRSENAKNRRISRDGLCKWASGRGLGHMLHVGGSSADFDGQQRGAEQETRPLLQWRVALDVLHAILVVESDHTDA